MYSLIIVFLKKKKSLKAINNFLYFIRKKGKMREKSNILGIGHIEINTFLILHSLKYFFFIPIGLTIAYPSNCLYFKELIKQCKYLWKIGNSHFSMNPFLQVLGALLFACNEKSWIPQGNGAQVAKAHFSYK